MSEALERRLGFSHIKRSVENVTNVLKLDTNHSPALKEGAASSPRRRRGNKRAKSMVCLRILKVEQAQAVVTFNWDNTY